MIFRDLRGCGAEGGVTQTGQRTDTQWTLGRRTTSNLKYRVPFLIRSVRTRIITRVRTGSREPLKRPKCFTSSPDPGR